MKNLLILFFIICPLAFIACEKDVVIPEMGEYSVVEVNVGELSGLCFNKDKSAFLTCGDKGIIKTVTFDGEVSDFASYSADMEGITLDPSTGDIYLAIEGAQAVHVLSAPSYNEHKTAFVVQEAVDGYYKNSGLEAVEYYKKDLLFVGSQKYANLWQYKKDGTKKSLVSLSKFATEVAGLSYEKEHDLLWVTDSKIQKIFLCRPDGTLLATYDIPFIENAESICVDRERGCVWVGSDETQSKVYRITFSF